MLHNDAAPAAPDSVLRAILADAALNAFAGWAGD